MSALNQKISPALAIALIVAAAFIAALLVRNFSQEPLRLDKEAGIVEEK